MEKEKRSEKAQEIAEIAMGNGGEAERERERKRVTFKRLVSIEAFITKLQDEKKVLYLFGYNEGKVDREGNYKVG